jgi:hypothetical protein
MDTRYPADFRCQNFAWLSDYCSCSAGRFVLAWAFEKKTDIKIWERKKMNDD